MARKRAGADMVLDVRNVKKRYVRYEDGKEYYGIGRTKFIELAHEAHAVMKVDRLALVDCEVFENFMRSFLN